MSGPAASVSQDGVGVPNSSGVLLSQLYDELRQLAAAQLAQERPGQTLQATALVHEAWLRLGNPKRPWQNRRHFFGAAAEAMRRVLIDRARSKASERHGGQLQRVGWGEVDLAAPLPDEQLLALNDALEELTELDPEAAELIKLRFFVGLSHVEAAEVLGWSRTAADRAWVFARAWLFQRLRMKET